MKLKSKLILGCFFLSLLIFISGGAGIFYMNSVERSVSHLTDVMQPLVGISNALLEETKNLKGALAKGLEKKGDAEIDGAIEEINNFESEQQEKLLRLNRLARQSHIDFDGDALLDQQQQLSALALKTLKAHAVSLHNARQAQNQMNIFKTLYNTIEFTLEDYVRRADSLMTGMSDRSRTLIQSGRGGITEYERILDQTFDKTYPQVSITHRTINALVRMSDLVDHYQSESNIVFLEDTEHKIQKSTAKIKSWIKRLKIRATTAENKVLMTSQGMRMKALEASLKGETGFFALHKRSVLAHREMSILKTALTSAVGTYEADIHAIVKLTDKHRDKEREEIRRDTILAMTMLTSIVLIGLSVSVAFGIFFSTSISKPIGKITAAMGKLAKGDMTVTVDYAQEKSEIGDLARALSVFKQSAIEQVRLKVKARQVAEEALQASDRANSANLAKTDFLANMSHELRTPLNAIIGFSDVIKGKRLGPDAQDKYLEYSGDIHAAGLHLLALINDILDLSKAESGIETLHESFFSIDQTTNDSLKLVAELAHVASVDLVVDGSESEAVLYADERKVKQILLNLLSNAIKFTPEGGSVTVRISADGEEGLLIDVIDTGIGIAQDDISKALTPFEQVDNGLNRKYEGTGLGLSISKLYTEMHGGHMRLQSKVSVGTCVTISFPVERLSNILPGSTTPMAVTTTAG